MVFLLTWNEIKSLELYRIVEVSYMYQQNDEFKIKQTSETFALIYFLNVILNIFTVFPLVLFHDTGMSEEDKISYKWYLAKLF